MVTRPVKTSPTSISRVRSWICCRAWRAPSSLVAAMKTRPSGATARCTGCFKPSVRTFTLKSAAAGSAPIPETFKQTKLASPASEGAVK